VPEPSTNDRTWLPLETAQSTLIAITALTAAVAPLGLPTMVAVLALVTLAQNWREDLSPSAIARIRMRDPAVLAAITFIVFATASTTWALQPLYALKSLAQAALTGLGAMYVAGTLSRQLRRPGQTRRIRFVRAAPLATLFIGLYFLLEFLTGNGVTLFFARNVPGLFDGFENTFIYDATGGLVGLDESYFNRISAALVLLTIGIVAALQFWPRRAWGSAFGALVCIGSLAICLKSGSATALLAFALSALTFTLALWSSKRTSRLLQVAYLIAIITAIPLSMLPKALDIDENPALPPSFRERVIIWNDVAGLALERPWLGNGVKSVKFLQIRPKVQSAAENASSDSLRTYAHPHNGYLQVWVELGLVGAALFAIAGALAINGIMFLPYAMQKYALALATGTLTMLGPGWDLWQPWLIAAIGFGWIALMLLRTEFELADNNPTPSLNAARPLAGASSSAR